MKVLLLTKKELQQLNERDFLIIKKNGVELLLSDISEANTTLKVNPSTHKGQVINPCDFGEDRIVLTILEGQELIKTGATTHTKNGVTYDIYYEDSNNKESITARPRNTYTHIIINDELYTLLED